jgi:hypothetical protein
LFSRRPNRFVYTQVSGYIHLEQRRLFAWHGATSSGSLCRRPPQRAEVGDKGCAGDRLSHLDFGTTISRASSSALLLLSSPLRASLARTPTLVSPSETPNFRNGPHHFRRRSPGRHCPADRPRQRGAQPAGRQLPRVHHIAQGDRRRARRRGAQPPGRQLPCLHHRLNARGTSLFSSSHAPYWWLCTDSPFLWSDAFLTRAARWSAGPSTMISLPARTTDPNAGRAAEGTMAAP